MAGRCETASGGANCKVQDLEDQKILVPDIQPSVVRSPPDLLLWSLGGRICWATGLWAHGGYDICVPSVGSQIAQSMGLEKVALPCRSQLLQESLPGLPWSLPAKSPRSSQGGLMECQKRTRMWSKWNLALWRVLQPCDVNFIPDFVISNVPWINSVWK